MNSYKVHININMQNHWINHLLDDNLSNLLGKLGSMNSLINYKYSYLNIFQRSEVEQFIHIYEVTEGINIFCNHDIYRYGLTFVCPSLDNLSMGGEIVGYKLANE